MQQQQQQQQQQPTLVTTITTTSYHLGANVRGLKNEFSLAMVSSKKLNRPCGIRYRLSNSPARSSTRCSSQVLTCHLKFYLCFLACLRSAVNMRNSLSRLVCLFLFSTHTMIKMQQQNATTHNNNLGNNNHQNTTTKIQQETSKCNNKCNNIMQQ